ncbi:hypothetical protein E2C01_005523 [Portunus trituberculatus]|uniref:Uncharacterized protein n=1 Tax=Portunus trituberculatus TaxID=210409 RepID=A0A5B7CZD4_PORTR|nr:hypothetical protein [Portunus trituberculatus]
MLIALEFSEFSTIWLRLNSHSRTKFICAVYLSIDSSDYSKFFDYLTSKVEHILSLYPFAKISIPGDFTVHHQLLLSSPFTDQPGELAFNFAVLHDLEQLPAVSPAPDSSPGEGEVVAWQESAEQVPIIIQAIRRRLQARLALHTQLVNLETANSTK